MDQWVAAEGSSVGRAAATPAKTSPQGAVSRNGQVGVQGRCFWARGWRQTGFFCPLPRRREFAPAGEILSCCTTRKYPKKRAPLSRPCGLPAAAPQKMAVAENSRLRRSDIGPGRPHFPWRISGSTEGVSGRCSYPGRLPKHLPNNLRHPRARGDPGLWVRRETLDSRLRGNDGSSESTVVGDHTFLTTKPPPPLSRRAEGVSTGDVRWRCPSRRRV